MPSIERAIVLRDRRRYEESIAELSLLLAREPENPEGHAQLALTYLDMPGKKKEALSAIDNALRLEADSPYYFGIKSLILGDMDRDKEALAIAEQAIGLEPFAFAWFAKARALTGLKRWKEAEAACETTLALDPDYTAAQNLHAIVLRAQGNLDAADHSDMRRLSRNAEDPLSLANAGWTALQRGDREKAEEFFRESLRIEPDNEYARDGLLQAYKSRSHFYRLYLKWVFFLQRHTAGKQMAIIIGLFLLYRFSTQILRESHPIIAAIIVFAYLFFAFGSFVAPGLGHFIILTDSLARLSLNHREKLDGLAVGLLVLLGVAGLVLGITVLPTPVALFGGCLLAASIPCSMVFRNYARGGQLLFGTIALFAVFTGIIQLVEWVAPTDIISDLSTAFFPISILSVVLCTWIGGIPGLMRQAEY